MRGKTPKCYANEVSVNCVDTDFGTPDHPVKITLSAFTSDRDGEGDLISFASFKMNQKTARDLAFALSGLDLIDTRAGDGRGE